MRWHYVVAVLIVGGAGAWFAFGPRTAITDAAYSRDKMVAGDAQVVTFESGWTDGYRYTRIAGEGWTWQRLTTDGRPLPDVVVNNGKVTAVQVAEACWVPLRRVQPPFIPGVTVATRLKQVPDVDREGAVYRYVTSPGESAIPSVYLRKEVDVEEDLSDIGERSFRSRTSGDDPAFLYGNYEVHAASAEEIAEARRLIAEMDPSPTALIETRERILTTLIANVVNGPYEVLVAGDCPEVPVLLRPAAAGGQRAGARVSAPNFTFVIEDGVPYVEDARTVNAPIFIEAGGLLAASEQLPAADVRLRDGLVVVVEPENGVRIAVQFASCQGQPFFQC